MRWWETIFFFFDLTNNFEIIIMLVFRERKLPIKTPKSHRLRYWVFCWYRNIWLRKTVCTVNNQQSSAKFFGRKFVLTRFTWLVLISSTHPRDVIKLFLVCRKWTLTTSPTRKFFSVLEISDSWEDETKLWEPSFFVLSVSAFPVLSLSLSSLTATKLMERLSALLPGSRSESYFSVSLPLSPKPDLFVGMRNGVTVLKTCSLNTLKIITILKQF